MVLPDSEPDLLVMRPLGGGHDDVAGLFPALEPVTSGGSGTRGLVCRCGKGTRTSPSTFPAPRSVGEDGEESPVDIGVEPAEATARPADRPAMVRQGNASPGLWALARERCEPRL